MRKEIVIVADDGTRFGSEEAAKRYEELTAAWDNYEEALEELAEKWARAQLTADGYPFEFGLLMDYYYVSPHWHPSMGSGVQRISFFSWSCRIAETGEGEIVLLDKADQQGGFVYKEYRINRLYKREDNALKGLVEVQKRWIESAERRMGETARLAAAVG